MRALYCLLLPLTLAAQDPRPVEGLTLDLRTELGSDPTARIALVSPGCWEGLVLSAGALQSPRKPRLRRAEATVEVWDVAFQESPRSQAFNLYLADFRSRLLRALANPPESHAAIELGELMLSDPGNPQGLNLTTVRSLQERFNRLPPNGSPVR